MTALACRRCATELPPAALACPACGTLVHADRLARLASEATAAVDNHEWLAARDRWNDALALLPARAPQHAAIAARVAELTRRIDQDMPRSSADQAQGQAPAWKRGLPGLAMIAAFAIGKLKFLLLGLTKASTFLSMFAFFGVYWTMYGWPLALGIALSIYVHEMGHVAMLRRLGLAASAPLFIPGVGAFVMLKQHVTDPLTDARIGLAGPVWGLGAALVAYGVHLVSTNPIWLAIAQLTGFLNLFNLIPIWQLDGSRGLHALDRVERWILVGVILLALELTGQRMLLLVAGVAAWRAFGGEPGPGSRQTLITYGALVLSLAWLATGVG